MHKKTCFVISCLALLALLFASPVRAGLGVGTDAPPISASSDRAQPSFSSWFEGLFGWFGRAFEEPDEGRIEATWEASKPGADSEEVDSTSSEIGSHPELGPDGDPDG